MQTKEFASQDNAALYEEELRTKLAAERQKLHAIPGMAAPAERDNDMDDEA